MVRGGLSSVTNKLESSDDFSNCEKAQKLGREHAVRGQLLVAQAPDMVDVLLWLEQRRVLRQKGCGVP